MIAVDVHQHLWPEPVLRLLERRREPPRALRLGDTWTVELAGEPPFTVAAREHEPELRARALDDQGVERALVALSSPVGLEALPSTEALAAVAAWHEAGAALPARLGFWAAVPSRLGVADQVAILRDALAAGAAGLCLAAPRLADPRSATGALELLAAAEAADVPVLVHPGPAGSDPALPSWWSPATVYVAQMHAAWHAVHAWVRPALSNLRVVFALLAGLAPLHAERTARRGGLGAADPLDDPRSFYDTSSYGPRALRAMAEAVGTGQLVNGSDHPVVAPSFDVLAEALGAEAANLVRRDVPARALGTEGSSA